jgi:hypothetical protein
MILQEIVLGETAESKRDAIQENFGQQVFVKVDHGVWHHGKLLKDGSDHEVYQMRCEDAYGHMRFWYHDTSQLLVVRHDPRFPGPDI